MSKTKYEQAQAYFDAQLAQYRAEAAALTADGRGDEAVFSKIRANVCEIFRSVLSAAQKHAPEGIAPFFLEKVAQLPGSWRAAQQEAERHGEFEKVHIESVKLDTAAALEAGFRAIWEVTA